MPSKNYANPRSYHDSKSCPTTLKDTPYEVFFSDICSNTGQKQSPTVSPDNPEAMWNGRCLWNYIQDELLRNDLEALEAALESNDAELDTLSRMPSTAPGSVLIEIGICCAAEVTNSRLKAVLDGYIKHSIHKGWDKHIKPFKTHRDLIEEIRNQRDPSSDQPRLLPPPPSTSFNYYGNCKLAVLGRDDEERRLRDFLNCKKQFAWFQLAGVGGQGKSRLAYDLALEVEDQGWEAGFLRERTAKVFKDKWADWQPDKPHLIIVDYVVGFEAEVKSILDGLVTRTEQLRENVRLLLLERQRFDSGGLERNAISHDDTKMKFVSKLNEYAEWYLRLAANDGDDAELFKCRFEGGVQELTMLDADMLVKIVQKVCEAESESNTVLSLAPSDIEEQLGSIDKDGRPLYAYFFGQQLASDPQKRIETRDDLLTNALGREYKKRWKAAYGSEAQKIGEDTQAMRIAVLGTIVGGIDCVEAAGKELIDKVDRITYEEALVISDSPRGDDGFMTEQNVEAIQPGILGEWFVISALKGKLPMSEILNEAWLYDPNRTAVFLSRIVLDFTDQPETLSMLSHDLPDELFYGPLGDALVNILADLFKREFSIPKPVLSAVKKSADQGNISAMMSLGIMFRHGYGVVPSKKKAIEWYEKAANLGDSKAMYELSFIVGVGDIDFEPDEDKAIEWCEKAADQGNSSAMISLGAMFHYGLDFEHDMDKAIELYEKAANLGDTTAMYMLGYINYTGKGHSGESGTDKALYYFRKAAALGDETSLNILMHLGWGNTEE